jgi:hypothetical protein
VSATTPIGPLIQIGQIGAAAARPLIRTGDSDRYFDYCLQPYPPRRAPAGKLRGENLLWLSLDVAGAGPGLEDAIRAIQRAVGRDMTVFGVKHHRGRLWWELYFYESLYEQTAKAAHIVDAVRPYFELHPPVRETIPYFMFSFDLHPDSAQRGRVEGVNLYMPYFQVQGGRSYKLLGGRIEMDNVYRFYDPKREIREIVFEIKNSVFIDYSRVDLSRVLLPELFSCRRICVAKKRFADAVYHSGIDVDQLLWFLRRFQYPAAIVDFVVNQRGQLDHLSFDVGMDFTMNPTGEIEIAKTSFYGTV